MNVVFVTHNQLGVACLEELVDLGANIQAVYTRESQEEISDQTDLEAFTERTNVPLHRVTSVNTPAVRSQISEYAPDVLFVIGWSRLVKPTVLSIPSVAAVGMHPAPLPRGRGRAPIAWSLIKGLNETALSCFHLVADADAGDLIGQEPIPIEITDDAASLYEKIVKAGRELIQQCYSHFESGTVPRNPQDETNATWWPKREPHQGIIDWTRSSQEIYNWIRGQTKPYPGAYSYLDGEKITVWEANPPDDSTAFTTPGEISYVDNEAVAVGTWEGRIEITRIQVGDDAPKPADSLVREYDFEVGDLFTDVRDRLTDDI
jgi:methionyl-tRNA formyltransferase